MNILRTAIVVTFASMAAAIGVSVLIEYLIGAEQASAWHGQTEMALSSAIAFVLLGVAVVAMAIIHRHY